MTISLAEFLGPFGLTVALLAFGLVLGRLHLADDERDRVEHERILAVLEKLVADGERRRRADDA